MLALAITSSLQGRKINMDSNKSKGLLMDGTKHATIRPTGVTEWAGNQVLVRRKVLQKAAKGFFKKSRHLSIKSNRHKL